MAYQFENFLNDCRDAYNPANGKANLEIIQHKLGKLLQSNQEFVESECGPLVEFGVHEIYRDPERGFIVYAHIPEKGRTSPPHDHGASWAIYGQTKKFTDMTEYRRLDDGLQDDYAKIEASKQYRLIPGMVGKFGPHEIHQISFEDGARFVRITGSDLFVENTLVYDLEANGVKSVGEGSATDKVKFTPKILKHHEGTNC